MISFLKFEKFPVKFRGGIIIYLTIESGFRASGDTLSYIFVVLEISTLNEFEVFTMTLAFVSDPQIKQVYQLERPFLWLIVSLIIEIEKSNQWFWPIGTTVFDDRCLSLLTSTELPQLSFFWWSLTTRITKLKKNEQNIRNLRVLSFLNRSKKEQANWKLITSSWVILRLSVFLIKCVPSVIETKRTVGKTCKKKARNATVTCCWDSPFP